MINNESVVQMRLPAILINGVVPLPNNEIKINIESEKSQLAIKEAMEATRHIVLLCAKTMDVKSTSDLYQYGAIAKVVYNMDGGGSSKLKVNVITRCVILFYAQTDPYYQVDFVTKPAVSEDVNAELACVRLLINEIESNGKALLSGNNELITKISAGITADKLADLLAFSLPLSINRKLEYLSNPSISARLKYLLEDIQTEKYLESIEHDIEAEVRKVINDSQKEYYLREKMRVIQNELGDKVKKETEIDELREKIKSLGMPKEIEEKALQEVARYSSMNLASGESTVSKTYLDFIISLPWSYATPDCNDIKVAKEQLDKDHYGLEKVKERILEYLAVKIMTGKNPQTVLCLVGPPGVGKTSLAKSIATALNKRFVKQSLGGVKDESEIRGHRRTYLGALPGRILQGMVKAKAINPVFLLDEIDKLSSDYRGDPASAMLEVLDTEQNKYFSDHYLEEPYDLSNVLFIVTANYLENIPAALRDRLEIVELSSYTEFEKFEIAKRHLIDKQLALHGLSKCDFSISDKAIIRIIEEYTKEAGVRELERLIGTLVRKSIKTILMEHLERVDITEANSEEWLGKPRFSYTKVDQDDQVGLVNGLAYTQYGGDTLPIEVTYYSGNGKLMLTGKLGDVMKESAQAALSYVKSNAAKLGIDNDIFDKIDIHVHVPEGAIPKDGPSAGVALCTAIASALSKRKVNHLVGMTGEITLRGRVLPIGGLREKAIAAHRSGLKKIIIPKDNEVDLDEIPTSVLNELEIVKAEVVDDVLNNAFI
ncbi:MAG: endopeptidase La [Bacilli bacterium]|nr:endopeptidase La [Bacilli bacterium]